MVLLERLPPRLRRGEVGDLQRGWEPVVAALRADVGDFTAQLDPSSATWGLALWERSLGLQVDVGKDLEFRRTRVISKLRGSGATTVASLKNVAESFSNGAVEVIEYPGEHRIEIKFVGTVGTPPNMGDLSAALDEVIPAHIQYAYVIIFRTWSLIAGQRWGELGGTTWDEILEGEV